LGVFVNNFDDFEQSANLSESYGDMYRSLLSIEADGWSLLGTADSLPDAFTLEQLHSVSARLSEKTDGNPLLKRGLGLRTSYIFGRGVQIQNVSSRRVQSLIDDPYNQSALFSNEAMVINERANFTSGQFFVLGDNSSKRLQRIPFKEITGWVTDPDDSESLRFIRRSWSRVELDGSSKAMHVWYPVDMYENPMPVRLIQNQAVDFSKTMFPFVVNKRVGTVWGVPDCLSAFPWANAYNEYLKDGSRILKALSMFAWQLKTKTKGGAQAAAATVIATPSILNSSVASS
jgi:hypothetical protein